MIPNSIRERPMLALHKEILRARLEDREAAVGCYTDNEHGLWYICHAYAVKWPAPDLYHDLKVLSTLGVLDLYTKADDMLRLYAHPLRITLPNRVIAQQLTTEDGRHTHINKQFCAMFPSSHYSYWYDGDPRHPVYCVDRDSLELLGLLMPINPKSVQQALG